MSFRVIRGAAFAASLLLAPLPALPAAGSVRDWHETPPVELRPGDLVCRRAHGPWSGWFASMSSREPRFSHAGVVWRVAPEVVLIHADADDWTGVGCVHEDTWQGFFEDTTECAVFRPDIPPELAVRFAEAAHGRLGVPFDAAFELSETNRLYCTELLAVALEETLGGEAAGRTARNGRVFIAVDDLYLRGFTRIFDSGAD